MQLWNLKPVLYVCLSVCVCACINKAPLRFSLFFSFFFPPSPSTPLVHSSLCVCMCLITHGPPLPSARHMVHSFASFDMRRLENVFVPVEFWHVFAAWQPEFRQSESRVVNKRHKISSNNKVKQFLSKSSGFSTVLKHFELEGTLNLWHENWFKLKFSCQVFT